MEQAVSPNLNQKNIQHLIGTDIAPYSQEILNYPEKVIQFGEGNFLRAFVEWMFHEVNKAGLFKGRVVAVQPIPQGRAANLNAQDGLYTLILRGNQNGVTINKQEIIPTISRCLEAYNEWSEVLKCAENPEIEYIISNTTEAGISFNPNDRLSDTPQESFPGKITAYLYHRFRHFNGDPAKGMVIIPCELIDKNASNLKRIVLQLAESWNLPVEFNEWVNQHNFFLNTLVDRIVTGYPASEVSQLENSLGYLDQNLNTGEIFHLWVIEGDEQMAKRLPFTEVGLNVKWVSDLTPYRTRKVRILNGAHTASVAVSYLSGINLVRDAVNDLQVGQFMKDVVFDEIIPTLDLNPEELKGFAGDVLERFNNPFIDHKWLDISLNSVSKYQTRVLPSLKKYLELTGKVPQKLLFSLAALIAFYHSTELKDNKLIGNRDGQTYLIQDDLQVLNFFAGLWKKYHENSLSLSDLTTEVLDLIWQGDWKNNPQIQDNLTHQLQSILDKGMKVALKEL